MQFLTIDQMRDHCKADSDDDALLETYADAAEEACVQLLNRAVFASGTEMATALAALPAAIATAYTNYDAAILAAEAIEREEEIALAKDAALITLNAALLDHYRTRKGIIITKAIKAAMLLMAGHLYRNREAVTAGQSAGAVELPLGVQNLLWPYVNVGEMA